MTDHENVLRDLLLECGVDGVTLWHIRCLAANLRGRYILRADSRWHSDLRGEAAVLADALEENAQRDLISARLSDAAVSAGLHGEGCNCSWCEAAEFQRRVVEGEVAEFHAANQRGD